MFITNIANLIGMNLEIGTQRLVLEGKPVHQRETQFEGFSRTSFVLKQALLEDNMSFHLLRWYPCEMSIEYNCENIPSGIFVTNHFKFEAKRMKDDDARYVQLIIMQHLITSIQTWFCICKIQVWGMGFSEKFYAMLLIYLDCLYL